MTDTNLPDVKTVRIALPPGVLKFPALLAPSAPPWSDKEKYQAKIVWPKDEIEAHPQWAELQKLILLYGADRLGLKHIGTRKDGTHYPKFDINGLIDGDESDKEYDKGTWGVRATANPQFPPLVLGPDGKAMKEDPDGLIFTGQIAQMVIGFYFYNNDYSGLSFNLLGVKIVGGGERGVQGLPLMSEDDMADALTSVPALGQDAPVKAALPEPSIDDLKF